MDRDATIKIIIDSLLIDFSSAYCVDAETGEYCLYSFDDEKSEPKYEGCGEDFFSLLGEGPGGLEELKALAKSAPASERYSLVIDGKALSCVLRYTETGSGALIVIGAVSGSAEDELRKEAEMLTREKAMYNHIAESLAAHYDTIYYVDSETDEYFEFASTDAYKSLKIPRTGSEFFSESRGNAETCVYPDDLDKLRSFMHKDKIVERLKNRSQLELDYRLVIEGAPRYARLTIMWASDRKHLIVGIYDVDDEVKKEKLHLMALKKANEQARRDELTGVKNKKAYRELESIIQGNIDMGVDYIPFAIVVCDINDLKTVNDALGHKAGDEYIREASKLVCDIFVHSAVFRVGGDEFVVVLSSSDFAERESLLKKLHDRAIKNMKLKDAPVIAAGMAAFDEAVDRRVADVFNRADSEMYKNKRKLKEMAIRKEQGLELRDELSPIPERRKKKLDGFFDAISMTAVGEYVFISDLRYDFSRFSDSAIEFFGLPAEYMYRAGNLWLDRLHPDDRREYLEAVERVSMGLTDEFDVQYRVRTVSGEYIVCSARGRILRDGGGSPEYLCGTIKKQCDYGNVDAMTGLRNQYGFFEDVQTKLDLRTTVAICIIGVNKFSEINEIYGYHFGNTVLGSFGRYFVERIGRSGSVYRLDGTKFAIISRILKIPELTEIYDEARLHFRGDFIVEGRKIILDLSAGALLLDSFSVDHRTAYACLNFAFSESKLRKHGDLVEFLNDLNDDNLHAIERLNAIRGSISQGYKGFFLAYQPVIEAKTERMIGSEALLRWKSDEYGVVPPDSFIPVLEKDVLFCDLGKWILRTAIRDSKEIIKNRPDYIINVNLAYSQIERLDFVDMVFELLEEENFPPENLCLEITERCRLLDIDLLKNVIANLRGRGVRIALDDFGTGFSSIGVVKNLPFDIIKIDRSFVGRIEFDAKERELIRYIAGVAATFGAKVCVEGVETAQIRDILQKFDIQSFQGYYYSKPLVAEELSAWLETNE